LKLAESGKGALDALEDGLARQERRNEAMEKQMSALEAKAESEAHSLRSALEEETRALKEDAARRERDVADRLAECSQDLNEVKGCIEGESSRRADALEATKRALTEEIDVLREQMAKEAASAKEEADVVDKKLSDKLEAACKA